MPVSDQQTLTVAAVCFSDDHQRILTVRKSDTRMFMFPGGKLEAGEDATAAAIREVDEEIGIRLTADDLMLVGTFRAPAANETDTMISATVFSSRLPAIPIASAEIAELRWVHRTDTGADLAPLLRDHVFPVMNAR
ncbi:NUDIX domain-containing protein [Williamsia sp. DF01-3]|uniref:NUDIX hydrolase n=1 Tax=Williamsia sp. DF01-3 TaxID=2934157 RepID=UPI001FF6FC5B|nr:NUDIX domain-containing protein [Williamsia sp. DF01-3]MCK0518970.1 NUDIX domain-containing protein [Williamsia sp. DF01-3]